MKSWDLPLFLLLGIISGLLYGWLIAPPQTVLTPNLLRAADQDAYREVIAAAYAANGDLERARARLSLFQEDPATALAAQAQRMLAAGRPFAEIQPLVRLATDLRRPTTTAPVVATPLASIPLLSPPTPLPSPVPETPLPTESENPPPSETLPLPTVMIPTPSSAFTPIPTIGGFFGLTDYKTFCDPTLPEGILQVQVMDERNQPLPGVPILLVWEGGQETFYSGLKPELGNGYADALLQPDLIYSLQVGGGEPVGNISPPPCPPESGLRYGALLLTFTRK